MMTSSHPKHSPSRTIQLSHRGIARVASLETNDFRFIVGGRDYWCCRSEAAFISARVCDLLQSDPTVTEYSIEGISETPNAFDAVYKLMKGDALNVLHSNCDNLMSFAISLGNAELGGLVVDFLFS
jgi:hypothetical protein